VACVDSKYEVIIKDEEVIINDLFSQRVKCLPTNVNITPILTIEFSIACFLNPSEISIHLLNQ